MMPPADRPSQALTARLRELLLVVKEAREMLRRDYPDSSLAVGNWPTIKLVAERWDRYITREDALLATEGPQTPDPDEEGGS